MDGQVEDFDVSQTTPFSALSPRLGRSVSLDQAAQLLRVSRRTVYNRIREGRLATIRTIGGSQRVLLESLGFDIQAPHATDSATPLTSAQTDLHAPHIKVTSW